MTYLNQFHRSALGTLATESDDFFRFLLYLCNVIDDFACLDLQH